MMSAALACPLLATPAPAAVPPQIDAAAKNEGAVIWYTSLDTKNLVQVVRKFNETHPGIVLQALQISSDKLAPRLMTEAMAGKANADVANGDLISVSQLGDAGILDHYRPSEPARFIKGSIDPKGFWVAIYNDSTVLAWNPQKVKADGLKPPSSLADLTRPEWKGKVGIDTTAFNWYAGVIATMPDGAEFFRKLAANDPVLTTGHTHAVTQLEAGEFDATPTAYGYTVESERELGRPVDYLKPRPMIIGSAAIALVRNAPHPNAARVLLDWLLSREGQQFIVDVSKQASARSDVVNDPKVFDASHDPFYINPPPDKTRYNATVSGYKAVFGAPP